MRGQLVVFLDSDLTTHTSTTKSSVERNMNGMGYM